MNGSPSVDPTTPATRADAWPRSADTGRVVLGAILGRTDMNDTVIATDAALARIRQQRLEDEAAVEVVPDRRSARRSPGQRGGGLEAAKPWRVLVAVDDLALGLANALGRHAPALIASLTRAVDQHRDGGDDRA
jgi:hypothetical protein